MSASSYPDPSSSRQARPTERTSILGRGRSSAATPPASDDYAATEALTAGWAEGEQFATEALPAGWAEGERGATAVVPTGGWRDERPPADDWGGGRPATAVFPAGGDQWASRGPAAAPSGRTTGGGQWIDPPAPAPAQPRPAPAGRRPQARAYRAYKRRTAATPIGTILLAASVALLGWGVYTMLVSFDLFDAINGAALINRTAATAAGVGAVLAFFAVITAFIACGRARPKTAACMLLLGSFLLPLAATGAAVYYGGGELKDRTLAEAEARKGEVDTTQVEGVFDQIESVGVEVPWRDELLRILGSVEGGA